MRSVPLLLVLTACGGGGGSRPAMKGPAAYSWGVSQGLWGQEQLTIAADGEAHYRFQSARGKPGVDRTHRLSPSELEPLRKATSDPAFCMLRSGRAGIPDEGQPSLAVRTDGAGCTVTLWDGEWEDIAAARPVRDAVYAIIERMKKE
jgi:hypothetical protein